MAGLRSLAVTDTHAQATTSYPPSAKFAAQANAGDELYREAEEDLLTCNTLGDLDRAIQNKVRA